MNKKLIFLIIIISFSVIILGKEIFSIHKTIKETESLKLMVNSFKKEKQIDLAMIKKFLIHNKYRFSFKDNKTQFSITIRSNEVSKIMPFFINKIKENYLNLESVKILFEDKVYSINFIFNKS
ncbi:MAG: hypothetical protein WC860_02270 [Candidatus Margulisiibacteriota bacterium]|jgi:hypothetical protein